MKTFIRCAAALIAAALLTGVLASIFSTQFVISGLESIDVNIPINDRLTMTLKDLAILKLLVLIVAICFTVGFLVAAFFNGRLGGNRTAWFILAGACAFVCTLLLMSMQMQLTPVAGARTYFGLFTQGLAGACGGWLFARLTREREVNA